MVLSETTSTVGSAIPRETNLLGVVVDMPRAGGYASLVALGDGTTSLYTSVGGGVIGAGAHEAVSAAAARLLEVLSERKLMFPADERVDLPPPEFVQITLLTRAAQRRANIESAAFWGKEPSTIPDIIGAIQDVLSALRELTPESGEASST
jgi:hypothetical protein